MAAPITAKSLCFHVIGWTFEIEPACIQAQNEAKYLRYRYQHLYHQYSLNNRFRRLVVAEFRPWRRTIEMIHQSSARHELENEELLLRLLTEAFQEYQIFMAHSRQQHRLYVPTITVNN